MSHGESSQVLSVIPKEFQTRSECGRERTKTEKGLNYDLEVAKRKIAQAVKTINKRLPQVNALLRENADLVRLMAGKDGLESEIDALRSQHKEIEDKFIRLNLTEELQSDADEYERLINTCLESLADLKMRIKDQEMERMELISQRSSREFKISSNLVITAMQLAASA